MLILNVHNFSTIIHTQKCDKMGVCEKNVENMQKLHTKLSPSYPQNVDN